MSLASRALFTLGLSSLALLLCGAKTINAQTVWSGFTKTFTRPTSADHTLPENQDALTENVILTRGNLGGLINFAADDEYTHGISPIDTEWATDLTTDETIDATNWQALVAAGAFTSWIDAFGGSLSQGSSIENRNAVVHLIMDDIYLDLRFTNWLPGSNGGFSYERAEPLVSPTPDGDYNQDGGVDAADYVMWRKTLNTEVEPDGSGADGDGDGMVNAGDYAYWVERFGNTVPGSGGGAAVPEPRAMLFAIVAVLMAACAPRALVA